MKITVITSGRQDWGILRNPVKKLISDEFFDISIVAAGMACSKKFGNIADVIEEEGYPLVKRLDWDLDQEMYKQTSDALRLSGEYLAESKPDALILLGDRFETLGFAQAAFFLRIPIIHLHGGEETQGAVDNQIRHAITKLSNIHFVSCRLHAERIAQMGENPDFIFDVGAPGLDNMHRVDLPAISDVLDSLNLKYDIEDYLFLVTYHPPTALGNPKEEFGFLLDAIEYFAGIFILTMPNNDSGGSTIYKMAEEFVSEDSSKRVLVNALGEKRYWTVLKNADVVIGNSSSGIIEAPAVPVPVVNIGKRQKGRLTASCIVNVEEPKSSDDIINAIQQTISGEFKETLQECNSPYGDGHSSQKIVDILKELDLDKSIYKSFHSIK
jgi:UDP-hydrolysing UDP-N-acetyl-D-glucosamine 2-epimerase